MGISTTVWLLFQSRKKKKARLEKLLGNTSILFLSENMNLYSKVMIRTSLFFKDKKIINIPLILSPNLTHEENMAQRRWIPTKVNGIWWACLDYLELRSKLFLINFCPIFFF